MSDDDYSSDRYDTDGDDDDKVSEGDAGKRAYHNLLERKRRDNIKDSFSQLRDVLPYFKKKKKASRVQILKKSCDFIKQQKSIEEFNEEIASLEEENMFMEKTLADLEKAIENNDEEAVAKLDAMLSTLKRRHFLLENEDTDSDDSKSSDEDSDSSPPQPSLVAVAGPSRRKRKRT